MLNRYPELINIRVFRQTISRDSYRPVRRFAISTILYFFISVNRDYSFSVDSFFADAFPVSGASCKGASCKGGRRLADWLQRFIATAR
jgi:hypothetical protein